MPITISGSYELGATLGGEVDFDFGSAVEAGGEGVIVGLYDPLFICDYDDRSFCGDGHYSVDVTVKPAVYDELVHTLAVRLEGSMAGFPPYYGIGTYYGFVDPTITIDNSSGDFSGYTVAENDGSSTVGAVPEPAAWTMTVVGVGAIGGALRGRKVSPRYI